MTCRGGVTLICPVSSVSRQSCAFTALNTLSGECTLSPLKELNSFCSNLKRVLHERQFWKCDLKRSQTASERFEESKIGNNMKVHNG